MGAGGDDAGHQVEDQVADGAEVVLDVVAEDPQEQHVAAEVQQASVEEHREQHRQPHRLVGEDGVGTAASPAVVGVALRGELRRREGLAGGDLTRDGGVLEVEPGGLRVGHLGFDLAEDLLALGLHQEVDADVGQDQHDGEDRYPAGGVVVPQGDHRRTVPAAGTGPEDRL